MDDNTGFRTAPTDQQLRESILLTVGIEADVHLLEPAAWERFADHRADPVPRAFSDALRQALAELNVDSRTASRLEVETEDRPPRADPLFAQYFVDLTALAAQLVSDFGTEIASGVITSLILGVGGKLKSLVGSRNDERVRVKESFNPPTLELLCDNFVRVHRPLARVIEASHKPFNTRYEAGYTFPVNPEVPMGWIITIDLEDEQFEFTVDGNADIHKLEIFRGGERSTMENASLKSPEVAAKTRQRISPWIGVADADSLL